MAIIRILKTGSLDPDRAQEYDPGQKRLAKIRRLSRHEDRQRSLGAGILLGEYLRAHGRHPDEVRTGPGGKPEADGLFFSLSHSGGIAVLAAADCEIGCDAEEMKGVRSRAAAYSFSQREKELLRCSSDPERTFYSIWTAKEAYLKMTGTGITVPMREIDVSESGSVDDRGTHVPVFLWRTQMENCMVTVCMRYKEDICLQTVTEPEIRGM